MESDKLFYASTHFYFTVREDDSVKISVKGNLYTKDNNVNYQEVEEFERQLKEYLTKFEYVKVSQEDVFRDHNYIDALERAENAKGSPLTMSERSIFYRFHILGSYQTAEHLTQIIGYVSEAELHSMCDRDCNYFHS